MKHALIESVQDAGGKVTETQIFGLDERLYLLSVDFGLLSGVILHLDNPPVHQIDTYALDLYASAFDQIESRRQEVSFLILSFTPDVIHAGGDLLETLKNLEAVEGYEWADQRLRKANALYMRVRSLATSMRTISILAGGVYYGGSAEVALWCDQIVGDSRASICMSEARIGLIPGWAGVARLLKKTSELNVCCLVETARNTSAEELKDIGVLDAMVDIPYPLPRPGDGVMDRRDHAYKTLGPLFVSAFALAYGFIGTKNTGTEPTLVLMSEDALDAEVASRSHTYNYRDVEGKPLSQVRDVLAKRKPPLVRRSIIALRVLIDLRSALDLDEASFAQMEMESDMNLYRDQRLAEGIRAVLEKRVPRFDPPEEKTNDQE